MYNNSTGTAIIMGRYIFHIPWYSLFSFNSINHQNLTQSGLMYWVFFLLLFHVKLHKDRILKMTNTTSQINGRFIFAHDFYPVGNRRSDTEGIPALFSESFSSESTLSAHYHFFQKGHCLWYFDQCFRLILSALPLSSVWNCWHHTLLSC